MPYLGGCSQNLISSREFYSSICSREYVFHLFLGVITSCALSLPAWISDASILPTPQGLRPKCLLSRFLPHTRHIRGIFQVKLSNRTGGVLTGFGLIWGDIQSSNQMEILVLQMVLRIASRKGFSHQSGDLECIADSSNTP